MSDGAIRLFVAVALPADARAALHDWAAAAGGRRPAADALHLTVVFIGSSPPELAEAVAASMRAAARPVGPLVPGAPLALPPRRPRVLALELAEESGALAALQADLARALERVERRPWRPHVTVARYRAGERPPPLESLPPCPLRDPLEPGPLTLYRSHLGRGGARYEALAEVPLAHSGDDPARLPPPPPR